MSKRGNDYIFFPETKDGKKTERLTEVVVVNILQRGGCPPEFIYAYHKCGFCLLRKQKDDFQKRK